MKKIISIILSLILILNPLFSLAEAEKENPASKPEENPQETSKPKDAKDSDELGLVGEGAILMDLNSSQILYEKNSNEKLYPASTTKIMTAILAIELGNLDDVVTIDKEITDLTEGSHIALDVGEQLSLRQLLYALLIESANDSAYAIAKHISGSIDAFVDLMNKKAKELGTTNTNFVNPNGLHDDNHYSSAKDLALISSHAMKNDIFRSIVKEYTYNIPPTNKKSEARYLKSANRLLYGDRQINVDGQNVAIKYDGAIGIKTGYTIKAQSCLVSCVEKNGRSLISVVLKSNGENIYVDTHKLLNHGFNKFKTHTLGHKNQFIENFNIKNGISPFVGGVLKDDISYSVSDLDMDNIKLKSQALKELTAPIKKGDKLGDLIYMIGDKEIARSDIVSSADIAIDPDSLWYKKILSKWYILAFILLFLVRVHRIKKIKRMRRRRARNKKIRSKRV